MDHVLIAGAGPVGMVAASCLADAGVPRHHPRAVA